MRSHSEHAKMRMRMTLTERSTVPKAIAHPTTRDLEWAAGFLEGEGSFQRCGSSEAIYCRQVNPEPIHRLQELFGGVIAQRLPGDRFGKQVQLEWHCTGARARGVMLTLYSLLSQKRKEQIKKALAA